MTPKIKTGDHVLALTVFALMVFGLVMIVSASAIISYANFGESDYYFWHQITSVVVSLVVWVIVQQIDYHVWQKAATPLIIIAIISLIAVFIPGIGNDYGTSKSWIDIGPLPSIQPAEFAKLALVIYLSAFFTKKGERTNRLMDGFVPFILVVGLMCGLLALQPDFGITLIVVVTAASIYFVAGANLWHIFLGAVMMFLGVIVVIENKAYVLKRFVAFINPDIDPQGIGYHIRQSLIAVGSGGLFGQGFGNSRQKYEYLPEAQGDSIFAITAEELGLIRIIPIIIAFLIIALRGFRIAENAKDKFGKLLATGITTLIVFQAFMNIGVVLSMLPTTGVPLPFISYGGSSLLSSVIGIAILLNISTQIHETTPGRRRIWWPHYTHHPRAQRVQTRRRTSVFFRKRRVR